MLLAALFAVTLPFAALGANRHAGSTRANHRSIADSKHVARTAYTLVDVYQGQSFFDNWTFFTGADPTNGMVNFVDADTAKSAGLAYVEANGTAIMTVDDYTVLPSGTNRNSVRITSNKSYNGGLFILDLYSMPHGCATWPAWWSVGPDWPNGGEIDVIEGADQATNNQYTLHTSSGCSLDRTPSSSSAEAFTSNILGTTCLSSDTENEGCGFKDPNPTSYGHGFNDVGGGVFAHLWQDSGISMWHFERSSIPDDIWAQTPDPTTWGPPAAFFSSSSCDIGSHFKDHSLVFDITLCGGLGDGLFGSTGCPSTCEEAVTNPDNFVKAKWKIASLAVYQ